MNKKESLAIYHDQRMNRMVIFDPDNLPKPKNEAELYKWQRLNLAFQISGWTGVELDYKLMSNGIYFTNWIFDTKTAYGRVMERHFASVVGGAACPEVETVLADLEAEAT